MADSSFHAGTAFGPVRSQQPDSSRTARDTDSSSVAQQTDSSRFSRAARRSPSAAFWRSVVLPGWGQFYNERPLRGCIYAGVITGCVAMAVHNRDLAVGAYGGSGGESIFLSARAWAEGRNNWIILGAFTYTLCILDAYVDGHLQTFDVEPLTYSRIPSETPPYPQLGARISVSLPFGR